MRASFGSDWARRFLQLGLLRSASLLVPAAQRGDWWSEWRGELWHVRQACATGGRSSWRGEREVTAFCLGAFQDAVCLRRAGRKKWPSFFVPSFLKDGSPRQCILVLCAILCASYTVALLLPGVRAERSLWPRKVNPNLVMIGQVGMSDDSQPTISPRKFDSWQGRQQKYFDGFSFYRVNREAVDLNAAQTGGTTKSAWGVARASSNLFTLMGLPIEFAEPVSPQGAAPADAIPQIILSEKTWKRTFAADPHIGGFVLRLAGQPVRIAGVAPDGSLGLPGRVDAWLLDPDADRYPAGAGFVVAHLTAMGKAEMWAQCVHITAVGPNDTEEDFLGISLEEWKPTTETVYFFALLLALLALPAITSVSLGEYSVNPHRTSWPRKLFRWSFLAAKIALLLPIVYFVSLDLAFGCTACGRESSVYIQLAAVFGLCLFGLRWVLKDQRQRCPVCAHCVTHPAQVGQASRTFLDWNGTEMMCMGGHTLLHVPSLPTSWFGAQRWLYLDTSWGFLFAGSTRPIP